MSESCVLMVGEEAIEIVIVLMEQGSVVGDAGARVVKAEGRCMGHHWRRSGNTTDVGEYRRRGDERVVVWRWQRWTEDGFNTCR